VIIANKLSAENKYIHRVQLDGKAIDHPFISHSNIINGSQPVFEMGPKPNKNWK